MESVSLEQAVKTVVARFDIFDFPLTAFEIWQFCPITTSYQEVEKCLATSTRIETHNGFFFMPGRVEIIATRQNRYRDSYQKIRTAKKLIGLFSWLPFIRSIMLANIIGPNNVKAQSDIDLFIVTKKNRVWMIKGIASFIFAVLNLRPTKKKSKNTVCLSYLVDETALDLSNGLFNNNDWYFGYWLSGLVPLYGSPDIYEELLEKNPWLKTMLPNWRAANPRPLKRFVTNNNSKNSFAFWNIFEKMAHAFHMLVLAKALRERANRDAAVIINDHVLKLHPSDRRDKLFILEQERLSNL